MGVSRCSVENVLSHSPEKVRRVSSSVSLNSVYQGSLCSRVFCHNFLSKVFCLIVPKSFVGEPFCAAVQKNSGVEKV